jgi:hypothetical protein
MAEVKKKMHNLRTQSNKEIYSNHQLKLKKEIQDTITIFKYKYLMNDSYSSLLLYTATLKPFIKTFPAVCLQVSPKHRNHGFGLPSSNLKGTGIQILSQRPVT